MSYRFVKGHGTRNDFVVLPDPDGSVHGELSPARVRALCDRRGGIGGDGVLRVVRSSSPDPRVEWFMDYRNSDGSVAQMCGNGVRVFAQFLMSEGWVREDVPLYVDTRAGVKVVTRAADGGLTVDMGEPQVLGSTQVGVGGRVWEALHVDMGNPHAVAFVDDLAQAGDLVLEPVRDRVRFPDGVNVEFAVRRGAQRLAMRVHERGVGETHSCGTGACAVVVASALADDAPRGTSYSVELPGGTLEVVWTPDGRILMTGAAVLVANGETDL